MSDTPARTPAPPPAHSDKPGQVALPRRGGHVKLRMANLADIAPETTEWLWSGRIPVGRMTLLTGERGVGKSLLAMAIAARVTMGETLLCHEGTACIGNVLVVSEDGCADTLRPRVEAAGGDAARIDAIEPLALTDRAGTRSFDPARDLAELDALIVARCVRLVIIDPVRPGARRNLRSGLDALADLARCRRVAMLLVAEPRTARALARIGAFASELTLRADPADAARRLLVQTRSSIAPRAPGLAFRLEPAGIGAPRIAWDRRPIPESEAVGGIGPKHATTAFLRRALSGRTLPVREIEAEAIAAGLLPPGQPIADSHRFRDARAALGVRTDRIARPRPCWIWSLPTIH